jgi:cytochrome b subunit of formate dehydrogenase
MNKNTRLKTANSVLAVSFVIQAITGLILFFAPDSSETAAGIHKYNGLALAILILLHIAFNWGWFKTALLHNRTG